MGEDEMEGFEWDEEGEEESYYLSDEDVESEQEDDRVPPALVPI